MAFDDATKMAYSVLRFLYRVGTLCISTGLFLFGVMIFKGSTDFGVIPFRRILVGFGLIFWDNSLWNQLNRVYAVGFLIAAFVPTRFYVMAYSYLK